MRTLSLLAASVLVTAGLAATAPAAVAEPYPGTVFTACDIGGRANVPDAKPRPRSTVHVKTAGTASPAGTLKVTYLRMKGGYKSKQSVAYSGRSKGFAGPRLAKRGRYKVSVRFVPRAGSVWKPCSDQYFLTRVKVVRR
ncbi:hypothetical protein QWY28_16340 [Nocardioides sp. SOB77]|uniref:Secreted protein n=1 Tax=Nocardioides oceani TaxID=3058369 RepID=A0ABT8FIL2_9ACTN|nr:hypothetical protein [Nocardioides oceani]MDN4174531.1 hypothetical protein [Nocardioides oceani]